MSSLATVAEKIETARPLIGGREAHPSLPLEEVVRLAAIVEQLPTEDHQPVDNIISERLMHLLVETLNVSWQPLTANGAPRSFLALANVGLYYSVKETPIVPDVMLSMDVEIPTGFHVKSDWSYFLWDHGKLPEVAIEIVSPTPGHEDSDKLHRYERIGVNYYAIFDPLQLLSDELLRSFQLRDGVYQPCADPFFPKLGLGLKPWAGTYGKYTYEYWLRWRDADGMLIPTATESIAKEAERTAALAAKLREMGIDPDQILKAVE